MSEGQACLFGNTKLCNTQTSIYYSITASSDVLLALYTVLLKYLDSFFSDLKSTVDFAIFYITNYVDIAFL